MKAINKPRRASWLRMSAWAIWNMPGLGGAFGLLGVMSEFLGSR